MVSGLIVSDWLYGAALFANAALFIPQAWRIFISKTPQGSSIITFAGFNFVQFLGIINGLYNLDYALIVGQSISLVACSLVTVQLALYKIRAMKKKDNHD
jgi:MtN3 and saliva related transmembrane protein